MSEWLAVPINPDKWSSIASNLSGSMSRKLIIYHLFNSHQSIDLAADFKWISICVVEMDLACRSLFLEERVINTPTFPCPGEL